MTVAVINPHCLQLLNIKLHGNCEIHIVFKYHSWIRLMVINVSINFTHTSVC